MSENTILTLSQVDCGYNNETIVHNFNLSVNQGEIISLLGPSGSGKTTILRSLAGFDPLINGEISLQNKVISKKGFTLAPEHRQIGLVFQDYALFPHLNVHDNIAFGLKNNTKNEKNQQVNELLSMMDMLNTSEKFPHELSGGQQQRVALARALATNPHILLMDEAFSNLDIDLRNRLSAEVCNMLKKRNITGILVTHDQDEAFAVSDRVAVLKDGVLQQWDTPYKLYHQPCNRFVATFIGQGKFISGKGVDEQTINTDAGILLSKTPGNWKKDSALDVLIRPDDVILDSSYPQKALVTNKIFHGAMTFYSLRLPSGDYIDSIVPSHKDFPENKEIGFKIEPDHLVAFQTR